MENPREYTSEEIREHVFYHLYRTVLYWNRIQREEGITTKEALENVIFSLFSMIDGIACGVPVPFIIATAEGQENADYAKKEGDNWYPVNKDGSLKGEITNGIHLHEAWFGYLKRMKGE